MNEWVAIFPIDPTPKESARAAMSKGGKMIHYTSGKTAHIENLIRDRAFEAGMMFDHGTAVRIQIDLVIRRPKSVPKSRIFPTVRPDYDNCAKLVADSLKGILFYDDCQICDARVRKMYGLVSCIRVKVSEIEPDSWLMRPFWLEEDE